MGYIRWAGAEHAKQLLEIRKARDPDCMVVPYWKSTFPRKHDYNKMKETVLLKILRPIDFLESIRDEFEYEANRTPCDQRSELVNPATGRIRYMMDEVSAKCDDPAFVSKIQKDFVTTATFLKAWFPKIKEGISTGWHKDKVVEMTAVKANTDHDRQFLITRISLHNDRIQTRSF